MGQPQKTIQSFQAGRGIAAVAVVFHHAHYGAINFGSQPKLIFKPLEQLYLGVDFFFVLSGFIIYHSTVGRGRTVAQYASARFRRVYLPYWPIGIGLALLKTLMPNVSHEGGYWSWITTLTLMPLPDRPALAVAWTLQHEVLFYAIFGLLYFTGYLRSGLILWAAIIIAAAIAGVEDVIPLSLLNLEFLMGVGAAVLYRADKGHPALLLLAPVPFAIWLTVGDQHYWSILAGLSMALIILPLARLESEGRFTVPGILTFFGAASYSIYLVHPVALSLSDRIPTEQAYPFHFTGNLLLGIAAGLAYFMLVERRLLRAARNDPRHERLTGQETAPPAPVS